MIDQANTTETIESRIKGDMDRHDARGKMSMDDQFYLIGKGIPTHAPIPDDVAAGMPSRIGKGSSASAEAQQSLSDGERQYLDGK